MRIEDEGDHVLGRVIELHMGPADLERYQNYLPV
jgi:hypothetical protein